MKKRLLCLLLVLVTALALCVSAAATAQTGAQLNYGRMPPDFSGKVNVRGWRKWRKRFPRNTVSAFTL